MAEGRGGTHRSKARAEGLRTEVGQYALEEDTSPLHIEELSVEDLRLLLTELWGPLLTKVTPGCSEL